jgi:Ca2+-binding RTX toxin-like protein
MSARSTKRRRTAVLATAVAAAALAVPATANAAVTGTVSGDTATLTGDAANDNIIISSDGTNLRHNLAGFNSNIDFDSATAGNQTLTTAGTLTIDGGGGDDIIVAGPNLDTVRGGDGNDRLTGGPGGIATAREPISGGSGNDVMIWNNGDGHDANDGDAGADETLITNGAADDQMTVTNLAAGRVLFDRSNAPFTVDMAVERLNITSFAGNDKLSTAADVTLPIIIDAGPGLDNLTTGAGADLVQGGDDVDTLNGGGGGDRILGNPGDDVMNGNDGDDTLVWNNGDGTDDMNGEAGLDRIENNLGAANDESKVAVVGGKVRFDRVNAPFGLNIATSEVLELNTFGGDDTLTVGPGVGALIAIDADAGAGNDRFNGGDEADTFAGGLGDDVLNPGAGSDSVDGQEGNDTLAIRDGAPDLARGGAGTDSATADSIDAVAADVENVDRAKSGANALAIGKNAKVKLKNGTYRAQLKLSCDDSAAEGCKGKVSLLTKVRIGGKRLQVVLASKSYDLDAGDTRKLKIKLPAVAKALADDGKLKVKAQAVSRNAAGAATTKAVSVTLKYPQK